MDKLKYQMIIQGHDEDDCFSVALPDFLGSYWRSHGDTYNEAVANGKERTCPTAPRAQIVVSTTRAHVPHLAFESLIIAYESTGDNYQHLN